MLDSNSEIHMLDFGHSIVTRSSFRTKIYFQWHSRFNRLDRSHIFIQMFQENSETEAPNSIRAKYSVGDFNAVHATSEVDEVDSEESLFFSEETIAVIKVGRRDKTQLSFLYHFIAGWSRKNDRYCLTTRKLWIYDKRVSRR